MADEKKPKIDLKARLGKTGLNNAVPTPGPGAVIPGAVPTPQALNVPMSGPPSSTPAPPQAGSRGLPVPPGIPVGPPPAFAKATPGHAIDPSNPLAAAMAPQRSAAPPHRVAPPQPQRIEVDEMAVQEARKGARKQGLVAGLVAALVLGAIGFIAGGANETAKGRATSVSHAKQLSDDVAKARDQLKTLGDKIDAGRTQLVRDHKFPDTLAKELGGINIDFDGTKLAGVRFSGFSTETTSGLIELITAVQDVNDRKLATINLLNHLQKPISDALSGKEVSKIGFVVLLGGGRDPAGNPYAVLAPLTKPIEVPDPAKLSLPTEFVATNPLSGSNVTAPKYTAGPLDKAAAIYAVPKSVQAACGPSETTGQIAQLGGQLTHLLNEIRGEQAAPSGDAIVDNKPGLIDRADTLIKNLQKVQ